MTKQVFVVEASAGTGKTFALAKRYIDLLTDKNNQDQDNSFRSILAITFTNKAASEMKGRIMRFMKEIAIKNTDSSLQSLDALVHNYNYFQVQTIDSFVNTIISACAFRAGLTADFEVRKDHIDYLSYSLDDLIDSSGADKEVSKVFSNFLDHYIFIENKTSWFPREDILAILRSMYFDSNIYGMGFNKYETKEDVRQIKKKTFSLIAKLASKDLKGVNKNFIASLNKFIDRSKTGFSIEDVSDYFKRNEIPVNKGFEVSEGVDELWSKIKKSLCDLCETEAFSTFNCYVDIYGLVMKDFEKAARAQDVMFLEELNSKALQIKEMIDVPELYWRLATRYRHFLLDEFQDTSFLQWNNLYPMIEEALSTGGTLFYVGDKKQSIYRFRGAAPVLFGQAKEQLNNFEGSVQTINMNYRSQKEIVDFNNMIFSDENLNSFISKLSEKNEDVNEFAADMLELYKNSKQQYLEGNLYGKVTVEAVDDKDDQDSSEIIEQKVIAAVKDLQTRSDLNDIAILCRDNDDVQIVTSWLLKESIPVESFLTLSIRENALIKEVISFLKFLTSPVDNLAFGSFITGSIFLKISGIDAKEIESFIIGWDRGKARERYLYKEFKSKYAEIWGSLIEEFFNSIEFVPLYEYMIRTIGSFRVMENFPGQQGFFMKLLEVIKDKEEDIQNVESFIKYFDETKDDLFVNAAGSDSVKVMTVHKAKGLGFGAVILPYLRMDVKVTGRGRSGAVIEGGGRLSIVRLKEKYNNYSNKLKEIYLQEYKRAFIDELNNVYVALTRAKNELYVFVPPRSGNAMNPVRCLLPEKFESGTAKKYPSDIPSEEPVEIKTSRYRDVISLLEDDEHIKESKVIDREKKIAGDMAHLVLSFIRSLKGKDVEAEINAAFLKAGSKYLKHDLEHVRTAVEKLINDKKAAAFFFAADGEIFTEQEVITSEGRLFRIDRLIAKKDEAIVVDYKSSKDNHEEYVTQLTNYMGLIKGIFRKSKVRGFLVYLDTTDIEEIHG
ncbi:MAG: UvrD-helicase domain-containing protein [Candidatus Saganbacteria bacterium]|nr:UvrD-helicase domain-containing protein [Candidatus Saganbacteria bacterium]